MAVLTAVQGLGLVIVATIVYNVGLTIYRLWFHPLARFPGPKIAAATQWYEIYYDLIKSGRFIFVIDKMHEKYGPIVRINPDELHIKDSDFYEHIYPGAHKKTDKYDKWIMMAGAPRSAFSTTSHDIHRLRRGALNPFFAKRSVVRLGPRISEKVTTLCNRLAECLKAGKVVDTHSAYMALTMDIITEYCYGHSYDFLLEEDFNENWKNCMVNVFENASFRRAVPWLTHFMQMLPTAYVLKLAPSMEILINWQKDIHMEVTRIVESKEKSSRESIFQNLIDSPDLPPEEKTVQRLADEGEILIAAGSETTAKTLSYVTYYILTTPGVLTRLRNELKTVMPTATHMPAWTELEKLPYLTAVVMEGLRISYGITTRLPRVAHEPIRYKEWVIPARTPVSSTTYFVSTDAAIFPDSSVFKPERWLSANQTSQRLDRYLTSFSKGTRACLGINLAYAELFLGIAAVFRRFDIELHETTYEDVKFVRDTFVASPYVGSQFVRVKVVREVD